MSDDLAAFLEARLSDDAEGAWDKHEGGCATAGPVSFPCDCGYPARVLREVAAMRKILDEHQAVTKLVGLTEQQLGFLGWYREWVLKNLAAPYSDHPDYREDFRA